MRIARSKLVCIYFSVAIMFATGLGCSYAKPQSRIQSTLKQQVRDWNDGNIDGFMKGYWKSDELTFSAGGETTRGWEATRARYRKRYKDREAMGTLAFSDLEVDMLGDDAAMALGRWELDRTGEKNGGNFTLVLRKIDGAWRIVHDHTSVSEISE